MILPMVLHGLWDSSIFLSDTTGVATTDAQWGIYPLAIVCAIAVLLNIRKSTWLVGF